MRPGGWFDEYTEESFKDRIEFRGLIKPKYKHLPKCQLASAVVGGKPYRQYMVDRDGYEVKGMVYYEVYEPPKPKIRRSRSLDQRDIDIIKYYIDKGSEYPHVKRQFGISQDIFNSIADGNYIGKDVEIEQG